MMKHSRSILTVAVVALVSMAAKCFSITDPFVVSVNVDDVTGVYEVDPNTVSFDPSCSTRNPDDYIDPDFELQAGGRLVDITVQTIGAFNGNVVGGTASVNGSTIVSYNGPWSSFNTPQSILVNNTLLTYNQDGVNALLTAVQNRSPITICHGGAFSEATPGGLKIEVKVFAQVDARP